MRRPSLPKLRRGLPKLARGLAKLPRGLPKLARGRRAQPAPQPVVARSPAPALIQPAPPAKRRAPPAAIAGVVVVVLVLFVVVLKACGGNDEQQVRDTMERFTQATRDKDYQALCDELLSSKLVEQLRNRGQPCEIALRIGLSVVTNPTLKVLSVKINGDQALAHVDTIAARQPRLITDVLLVKEDGHWRILSLPGEQSRSLTP